MSLKIATVGCGYFSRFHHEAWQRLAISKKLDLTGVCDIEPARAERFCQRYGFSRSFSDLEKMIEVSEPDLIDLIVPPSEHLRSVELCALAGIDVICQKPFAQTYLEAQSAAALVKKHNIRLVVHENFRFQPWYRQLKQLLIENHLGEIYQCRFALRPGDGQGEAAYMDRQPYFQQMPEFLIRETGIHFIDVFRYLFGPVDQVWADLQQLNPAIAGEDSGLFILRHQNNVRSVFDGNRLADHVATNRRLTMGELLLEGSDGSIALDGDGRLWHRRHGKNQSSEFDYNWTESGFGGDCVYSLQQHVIEHFLTGSPLENEISSYLSNLSCQDAVYRSNQSGQWQVPD
ncbi:MAG: Gfo/Idh/MocA family oxidoreductase [Pseudomonadota bacterium]